MKLTLTSILFCIISHSPCLWNPLHVCICACESTVSRVLKTISLLQKGAVQRMTDELLKWLFGVNEVWKMFIAAVHYVVCWYVPYLVLVRTTTIHFSWSKNSEKWVPTVPCFINLYLPISVFQNMLYSSAVQSSSCPFLSVPFLFFAQIPCSLLTWSSKFPLVTAHPVIILSDSSLLSFPCFKEPLPLGGWTRIWTNDFWQPGLSCTFPPTAPAVKGEKEEEEDRETHKYT